MKKHYGNLVETVVRREVKSISEFAKLAKVNRRSIYNWFHKENLKQEIIFRIGCAIDHDFSHECPEYFTEQDFNKTSVLTPEKVVLLRKNEKENDFWKNKYLRLLEEYTHLLSENAANTLVNIK